MKRFVVALLCCTAFLPCEAGTDLALGILSTVRREIGDLTFSQAPLKNARFVRIRSGLQLPLATEFARIVKERKSDEVELEIAILICTGLERDRYFDIWRPLLVAETPRDLLSLILQPPFPYGPGLAFATEEQKAALRKLRFSSNLHPGIGAILDDILSGKAGRVYTEFERDPSAFGY